MSFNFETEGPIDYMVYCYEQIPKEEVSHRATFLELFLERMFSDCTGARYIPGGRTYKSDGIETLDKMFHGTTEELEPIFYDVCENILGAKKRERRVKIKEHGFHVKPFVEREDSKGHLTYHQKD